MFRNPYFLSVSSAWKEALASDEPNIVNEFPRLFKTPYFDRLNRYLELDGEYQWSSFFIPDALVLYCLDKDEEQAKKILGLAGKIASKVNQGDPKSIVAGDPTTPSAIAYISTKRLRARVDLSIAMTAHEARSPVRQLLAVSAIEMREAYKKYGGRLHDADRAGLMLGILAALLAHELDVASDLLSLSKTCPSHPRHLSLFKNWIRNAVETEIDGQQYLRVSDSAVIKEFFGLFNIYRLPLDKGRADIIGEFKRKEFPIITSPIGNYLFTWLYIQSIAEPPVTQATWGTLRELMTG